MMKRILHTILILIFFCTQVRAQIPTLTWAKNIGSVGSDWSQSLTLDVSGNICSTGIFQGNVDFDPGPGTYTLGSLGSYDTYISKLDANGNFIWARSVGGNSGTIYGLSIDTDVLGNIYLSGGFTGTVDLDPGPASFTAASLGLYDIFILKLDVNGNFLWAKQIGSSNQDMGLSIAIDGAGNVCVSGYYYGLADFDPGAATYNLPCTGAQDLYILKLDTGGNFMWVATMGGTGSDVNDAHALTIDGKDNIYATGYFVGTIDFDPGPGTYTLSSTSKQLYVLRLGPSGNFKWVKAASTPTTSGASNMGLAINVDVSGNVLTTGLFGPGVDFDPGPGVNSLGTGGMFVWKLDSLGNFAWAKEFTGTLSHEPYSITTDVTGNVYFSGYFTGTNDFDPGPGTYSYTSSGNKDMFIVKLDVLGNLTWALPFGASSFDAAYDVVTDVSNNLYVTGYFSSVVDFDPGPGTFTMTAGSSNIFVMKLAQSPLMINEITDQGLISIYPNPAAETINICSRSKINSVKVFSVDGKVVLEKVVKDVSAVINISELKAGIYFVEVNAQGESHRTKVVKE